MFSVEDRHWWYVGMKQITVTLVSYFYPDRRDLAILDAGCGTGATTKALGAFGTVTGCDLSALALHYCRKRGLAHLGQASIVSLPFPDNSFDLVTSFDVLYHRAVADYSQALEEFYRVLRPGGLVLLRLPAYDWLRGRHDEAIHTSRWLLPARSGSDIHPNPHWQDALLVRFLLLEARWLSRRALPFGLSVLGIGRKPEPL
jgi:SAM-dependent methyltransferase